MNKTEREELRRQLTPKQLEFMNKSSHPMPEFTGGARIMFVSRFRVDEESGCWVWVGPKSMQGYGRFNYHKRPFPAHRVSYKIFRDEDPYPFHVMHLCDNPPCVNPEHLRLGTQSDNQIDSSNKKRHFNSSKTHCPKGHKYTPRNTFISYGKNNRPKRKCRACDTIRRKENQRLAKLAAMQKKGGEDGE